MDCQRPGSLRGVRIPASWLLALVGLVSGGVAIALRPASAAASASQDYPAFVLVAGLLLIGLVADDEGLFAFAGRRLAALAPNGIILFAGAVLMIGAVTAVLNLDTSVAFLTPVLVYAARSRHGGESVLLYGCLMLSNAGSLLLPGANLTNLIVLGHLRLTGGEFIARMWLPALAALVITAAVIAILERDSLLGSDPEPPSERPVSGTPGERPVSERPVSESAAIRFGVGQVLALVVVAAGTVLVVILRAPAIPVFAVGVLAAAGHVARGRSRAADVVDVLGLPLLVGLFGVAVALGTLGRAWSGPATLLSQLDSTGTAAVAAATTIVVNNLPAASLLAARVPAHPFPLLLGLNVGPNLCVTGSLAWLLWLRAARRAGASPRLARASVIGVVAVPLALAAGLAGLMLTGAR